jgi:putative phage-type endonuclease
MTRQEWLKERKKGIGASEAAVILGLSPYKDTVQLWREKTGRAEAEDISDKPYVQYGIDAEAPLRTLYALDNPQYKVEYEEFDVIRHPKYPFLFATLDGRLLEIATSRMGVYEGKTTEIFQPSQWREWDDRVPDHYYTQILHQLNVTQWDFAVLNAQIKWMKDGKPRKTTQPYHFERLEELESIKILEEAELRFWEYVLSDKEPPRVLPNI